MGTWWLRPLPENSRVVSGRPHTFTTLCCPPTPAARVVHQDTPGLLPECDPQWPLGDRRDTLLGASEPRQSSVPSAHWSPRPRSVLAQARRLRTLLGLALASGLRAKALCPASPCWRLKCDMQSPVATREGGLARPLDPEPGPSQLPLPVLGASRDSGHRGDPLLRAFLRSLLQSSCNLVLNKIIFICNLSPQIGRWGAGSGRSEVEAHTQPWPPLGTLGHPQPGFQNHSLSRTPHSSAEKADVHMGAGGDHRDAQGTESRLSCLLEPTSGRPKLSAQCSVETKGRFGFLSPRGALVLKEGALEVQVGWAPAAWPRGCWAVVPGGHSLCLSLLASETLPPPGGS